VVQSTAFTLDDAPPLCCGAAACFLNSALFVYKS